MFVWVLKVAVMVKDVLILLVMFWNLENFFDPFPGNSGIVKNDSIGRVVEDGIQKWKSPSEEEPFTPGGEKFWTWRKFGRKRDDIARTIALVKEQFKLYPALVGVAEVENSLVLEQLTQNTILAPLGYGFIHNDSPDSRGIDVALLYRKSEFKPSIIEFIPLKSIVEVIPTREMLYTKGLFRGLDTLHLFVVHWPSKLGGREAVSRREEAGKILKKRSDSIIALNPMANVIVMGDFNDDVKEYANSCAGGLVCMSGYDVEKENRRGEMMNGKIGYEGGQRSGGVVKNVAMAGTYKYKGVWERIDHFFVSPQLYGDEGVKFLFCKEERCDIFAHPFLLEEDRVYLGYKVRRTLVGPRYNGGVSDHLPILLKVYGYPFE